jgi:hypothetical protein
MLEKRIELQKSDLMILLSWLKGDIIMGNKKFNFDTLLERCATELNDSIRVDDYFDDLMFDLYLLYEKLCKITPEQLEEKIIENPMFKILPKEWVAESMRSLANFLELYENLMMSSKFENIQIRGIQKNMMNDLLKKYIMNEEFEKCIDLKEKLKEV